MNRTGSIRGFEHESNNYERVVHLDNLLRCPWNLGVWTNRLDVYRRFHEINCRLTASRQEPVRFY